MDTYTHRQYISLNQRAQQAIVADISQRPHIEACGLLLGSIDEQGNWLVEDAHPLRNIFDSPVYFEFDPEELLRVELTSPNHIVGVYHSHPTGFARASDTDCQNMQRVNVEERIPWAWLIICGPFTSKPIYTLLATNSIAYHHFDTSGLQRISLLFSSLPADPDSQRV